jgi:NCAIR mutase (PurE)-related protein
MDSSDRLKRLLVEVADQRCRPEDAWAQLQESGVFKLPFARLDLNRMERTGLAEAIYGPGKSLDQIGPAVSGLLAGQSGPVILTRASWQQVEAGGQAVEGGLIDGELPYDPWLDPSTHPDLVGREFFSVVWRAAPVIHSGVMVVTAGTADIPVAVETMSVCRAYGIGCHLEVDCGVAGLGRILRLAGDLARATAVVVVAGMEGALASVVAGLTPAPIVAVPTSAGYGVSLSGLTALLAMLASCSPGVTVVGIDNGFGAGCALVRMLSGPAGSGIPTAIGRHG